MTNLFGGKIVKLAKCYRCGCRKHSIAFADSNYAQLWAECKRCGRKRRVSLDDAYEAVKRRIARRPAYVPSNRGA